MSPKGWLVVANSGFFSLIYIQWEFFITSNDMIDDVNDWSMYVILSMQPYGA